MKRKMSVATRVALGAFVLAALSGVLFLPSSDNAAFAQSSPSISIELSPGSAVPANTEITATITLSNLDVNSYSSIVFRADVTRWGHARDICEGDGIGEDIDVEVNESKKVLTATVPDACPIGGSYALEARAFRVNTSPPNDKVELASARAPFVVSKYLMPGVPTATPPVPKPQAWLDPDPTSLDMQVHGEWQRFFVRSDVLESVYDHVYLYFNDTGPGHFPGSFPLRIAACPERPLLSGCAHAGHPTEPSVAGLCPSGNVHSHHTNSATKES